MNGLRATVIALCLVLAVWAEGDAIHWRNRFVGTEQVHTYEKTQDAPAPDKAERFPKEQPGDFWSTKITDWVTILILFVQAVIFVAQGVISYRQWQAAKSNARAANTAANAAKDQIKLARKEFAASHRPKLHIRHVWINDLLGQMVEQPGFGVADGNIITGHLVVVNVGTSEAIISRGEYRIVFRQSDELPPGCYEEVGAVRKMGPPKEIRFGSDAEADRTFQPGMSCIANLEGVVRLGKQEAGTIIQGEFARDGWKVFIFGQIVYADSEGRERFIGFARRSDLKSGFRPIDDPDYEYQD